MKEPTQRVNMKLHRAPGLLVSYISKQRPSAVVLFSLTCLLIYMSVKYNVVEYIFALPFSFFSYPLEVDMKKLVEQVQLGERPSVEPINPVQYPIILDNPRLCKTEDGDDDAIFLLWVIKSRMENFAMREAIRKTWGAEDLVAFSPTRRVFLLGVDPENTALQQKIALEHQENHDIVQCYFRDQYFNNTIKLMVGFQWAVTRCHAARYVGFMDDDFFLAPENVVEVLKPIPQPQWENFLMGFIWDFSMPFRIPSSKWYISLAEYPYRFWPPYPTAGCFFVSMLVAEKVNTAMQYTKYIRFDDVFVGIVTWKLQIPLKHNKYIYFDRGEFPGIERIHKKVLGVHGFKTPDELLYIWKRYQSVKRDKPRFGRG